MTRADGPQVVDNTAAHRFELTVDGYTGFLTYERTPTALTLVHTEVPPQIRGRHLADRLVDAAADAARAAGLQLVVVCPFAREYLRRQRADQSGGERRRDA